jgi:hypothetical protein
VGPRTGLDITENFDPTGIRSPVVQPIAIRYTEYAISAASLNGHGHLKRLCLILYLSAVIVRSRECQPYYSNSFFNILRLIMICGDFQ